MASCAPSGWDDWMQGMNRWLSDFAPIQKLADKCGVQPFVVGAAGALWFVCFILWGFASELICTVVGTLYPLYASFKALEDSDHEGIVHWLVYWVAYASMVLVEGVVSRFLFWVPFYHLFRLLLLVWLFVPMTGGAKVAYRWAVSPTLRRYRPAIDGVLQRWSSECADTLRGERNEELRQVFFRSSASAERSASPAARRRCSGQRSPSQDLGIQELMAKELAREAASRLTKVAAAGMSMAADAMAAVPAADGRRASARSRADSPRPPARPSGVEESASEPSAASFPPADVSPVKREEQWTTTRVVVKEELVESIED